MLKKAKTLTKILIALLFSLISFCSFSAIDKRHINIAAASDMKFALETLVKTYKESDSNIEIGITAGSSGKFYEQISSGAPFDLFFSADIEFPQKLKEKGFGNEIILYGSGQLVIWSMRNKITSINDLTKSEIKKISIANPRHAPYGVRTIEALQKSGIYESIKDKLVFGENVSQAAQFIETGAADIGIIALSIVLAPNFQGKGNYQIVPAHLYTPLTQGMIVINNKNSLATDFFKFMQTPKAKSILKQHGFFSGNN